MIGRELRIAKDWLEERREDIAAEDREFIQQCIEAEANNKAKEAEERRKIEAYELSMAKYQLKSQEIFTTIRRFRSNNGDFNIAKEADSKLKAICQLIKSACISVPPRQTQMVSISKP